MMPSIKHIIVSMLYIVVRYYVLTYPTICNKGSSKVCEHNVFNTLPYLNITYLDMVT